MGDCLLTKYEAFTPVTQTILSASVSDGNNGWRYVYCTPSELSTPIYNPVINYSQTIINRDSFTQRYSNSGIEGYTNGSWVTIVTFEDMVIAATSSGSRSGTITVTDNKPYTNIRGRSFGKHQQDMATNVSSYQTKSSGSRLKISN